MKKLFLLPTMCLLMMLAGNKAMAYSFFADNNGQTIYYNITSTSLLTVAVTYETTSYNSYSGSVDIPSTVINNDNGKTYSVTSIGSYAFNNCHSLTEVTIPNSVTSIGSYAFRNCSLPSLTIPNSVTSIGSYAFSHGSSNSSLTSVTIGNSVTSIGDRAFYNCSGLTEVTIPNSVTTIGTYTFSHCSSLTEVTIGNSVTSIGTYVFRNCSSLTKVTIGNSVTSIGYYAFSNCSSLTELTIPNSVTTIEEYAFRDCSSLTELTIPNSVTTIGEYAFYYCSSLTEVTIPNSVTSIGDAAFYYCSGLTEVTIPNSVTAIGYGIFYDCHSLTEVTIPNSVTSIGDRAFYDCHSLTEVTIPNSVTSIGSSAFRNCSSLTELTIPNSVTSIENYAFSACDNLTSVTIGNSVTTIGSQAFRFCNITELHIKAQTPPAYGTDAFSASASIPVYVPCGTILAYKAASGWDRFTNYKEEAPSLNLTSNNSTWGTVSITKHNNCANDTAIIAAEGCFARWSDDNTDNPRTIIITQDTTFTAIFSGPGILDVADKSDTICSGSLYTLTTEAPEGATYTWEIITDNPNISGQTENNGTPTAMQQTLINSSQTRQTLTYRVTLAGGCQPFMVEVTVHVPPSATIKANGVGGSSIQACEEEDFTLTLVGVPPFTLTYTVDPNSYSLPSTFPSEGFPLQQVENMEAYTVALPNFVPDTYTFHFTHIATGNGCSVSEPE